MLMDGGFRRDNVITVVGSAEVRARATLMHVVLEVRTRGGTAAEALEENHERDRVVRARLRGAGVHEESVETSGITFIPAAGDGVGLSGSTEPQGFIAVRSLGINLYIGEEDPQKLWERIARILDEASEGGAHAGSRQQVNLAIFRSPPITFALESGDEETARNEALRRAMGSSRAAAEEAARAAGVELEEMVSTQVLEMGNLVQGRFAGSVFGVPGLDMPRPMEAGRVSVRAVVAVTYRVRRLPALPDRERIDRGHFTLEQAESAEARHRDRSELG